jgi:predicted Zn-dependent peptidase
MKPALALAGLSACLSFAQVRLPQYTRTVLANGIVLDVMPRTDVPLVTIRVNIRGGIESEPAELSGLASVTSEALRRGTAKRTADQFSEQLDALGALWSTGADNQSTSIATEFLAKDFDTALELLYDAVVNPTFPEAEIKKLLTLRVDRARSSKDNPGVIVRDYYRSFFYGPKHPYGRPADELSYARIRREDIVAYHKLMYTGKNMVIVAAGDINASEAAKKLSAAFGSLSPGKEYTWVKPPKNTPVATRLAIVDKPDSTQTRFLIGQPGIDRTNPDRVALWVVNTIFGGRFTSILNDELRVNTGLTYGASSVFEQNHLPGSLHISSFTQTDTTAKAIDVALELSKRLSEKGITAEQLQSAKSYLKGIYPSEQLETADQLADVLSEIELFDLNRGEIDDLFARIDAVTLEKANQIAKRYYAAGNLTFVLLGNAAKIESHVRKYAPAMVKVPITRPGVMAAP